MSEIVILLNKPQTMAHAVDDIRSYPRVIFTRCGRGLNYADRPWIIQTYDRIGLRDKKLCKTCRPHMTGYYNG